MGRGRHRGSRPGEGPDPIPRAPGGAGGRGGRGRLSRWLLLAPAQGHPPTALLFLSYPRRRDAMEITPQTHVAEIVTHNPAATKVFHRYGIDFCCGGKRPL